MWARQSALRSPAVPRCPQPTKSAAQHSRQRTETVASLSQSGTKQSQRFLSPPDHHHPLAHGLECHLKVNCILLVTSSRGASHLDSTSIRMGTTAGAHLRTRRAEGAHGTRQGSSRPRGQLLSGPCRGWQLRVATGTPEAGKQRTLVFSKDRNHPCRNLPCDLRQGQPAWADREIIPYGYMCTSTQSPSSALHRHWKKRSNTRSMPSGSLPSDPEEDL